MKVFNIFLIIVGMSCPFTEGEIHHYNLEIIEKGTTFTEGIEIDEEQNIEIFRVPAHNNVSAADFYHDFERGVTVIKMLSEKVCYITAIDSSLPSPGKLKENIQRATSQRESLPVTTKPNFLMPVNPAHSPSYSKGVLAFCGVFPIYKADVTPMNTSNSEEETTKRESRLHSRQIRQAGIVRNFTMCDRSNSMSKVQNCMDASWSLNCRIKYGACFYFVTCTKRDTIKSWVCQETHLRLSTPVCCEFICP